MRLVRPSDTAALERMVEELHGAEPTYRDRGGTLAGIRPEGFHHDHDETLLGQGPQTYLRAVEGLKTWKAHRQLGMAVFPVARRSARARPSS